MALDHGSSTSRRSCGDRRHSSAVHTIADAGPDAIQLTLGQARHLQSIPGKQKPSLVLAHRRGERLWHGAAANAVQPSGRRCRGAGAPTRCGLRRREFVSDSERAGSASTMRREYQPAQAGLRALRHAADGRAARHAAEQRGRRLYGRWRRAKDRLAGAPGRRTWGRT